MRPQICLQWVSHMYCVLSDCIECLLRSEHQSILMHLIRIYNIINFCMLLQQEMAEDFLVSYQSWDKKGICWRDKEKNCQRFLIYLLDKCGVWWKLTEQYLPRNVPFVAFQGPKKAHFLDSNRLSSKVCSCLHTQKVTYRHPYSCFSSSSPNNLLNDTANTWFLDLLNHVWIKPDSFKAVIFKVFSKIDGHLVKHLKRYEIQKEWDQLTNLKRCIKCR